MLMIRDCETCGSRIRTTPRALARPGSCPYCRAERPVDAEPAHPIAPTAAERAVWWLGLLTEAVGVMLPPALILGRQRFSMSWLGAGLVGAILAWGLVAIGRVARRGSPDEGIKVNIAVLVLLYVLAIYGALAFSPLDALGGSAMVLLAACAIIMADSLGSEPALTGKAEKGRAGGWLILLLFTAAYAYHAVKPWIGR